MYGKVQLTSYDKRERKNTGVTIIEKEVQQRSTCFKVGDAVAEYDQREGGAAEEFMDIKKEV